MNAVLSAGGADAASELFQKFVIQCTHIFISFVANKLENTLGFYLHIAKVVFHLEV